MCFKYLLRMYDKVSLEWRCLSFYMDNPQSGKNIASIIEDLICNYKLSLSIGYYDIYVKHINDNEFRKLSGCIAIGNHTICGSGHEVEVEYYGRFGTYWLILNKISSFPLESAIKDWKIFRHIKFILSNIYKILMIKLC